MTLKLLTHRATAYFQAILSVLWGTRMSKIWQWIRNKAGRITTAVGGFLASVQVFDLSVVKQPLVDFFGDHWATKIVSGGALVCFLLSYWRHQHVANKVGNDPAN